MQQAVDMSAFNGPIGSTAQHQPNLSGVWRPLRFLTIISGLSLTILACGLFGTGSDQVAVQNRLPTLTRTPLPTLTPTAEATALAQAQIESASSPMHSAVNENMTDAETGLSVSTENSDLPQNQGTSAENLPSESSPTSSEELEISAIALENGQAGDPASLSAQSEKAEAQAPGGAAASTPTPTIPPTATATDLPPPTAIPTDTPPPAPTDTPTPTPLPEGWIFTGVRIYPNQGQGDLLLYGEVTNNSSSSQELAFISGTFYDGGGQPISDIGTVDYWPVETVPPGGRIPFELTVYGPQDVSDVDLSVEAGQSEEIPSQAFEFLDVNQSSGDPGYCLSGKVRNPGGQLNYYLAVVAVLYDAQDKVISFGDDYKYAPKSLLGEETVEFEACADPLDQEVVRHEVRAWGL